MSTTKEQKWSDFHKNKIRSDYPKWPNETILKLFFGSYLREKPVLEPGQRLLDVGCGFGQNFYPFLEKGIDCFGVEVDGEIAQMCQQIHEDRVEVKVGHNRHIDYPDGHFDYVLSVNAIHYESNEADMKAAIDEHYRVLKKGGSLVLFTVGPEHSIFKKAKALGDHRYQIQNFDFRDGQVYFYFGDLPTLENYLIPPFESVELGRVTESLMEKPLDFLVAVAKK